MKIYDISAPIYHEMPVYPGDPPVTVERTSSIAEGDSHNVSRLDFGSHTGTHVDAPLHFLADGVPVDALPLDVLMGPALVVEISDGKEISREVLARLPLKEHRRVLFKTTNSRLWSQPGFFRDYVAISEDAARLLVERGVMLVGIDYLSVERFQGTGNVHRLLLENSVVIIEGLDLGEVPPGEYELICLPLRVQGGDGAPARVILRSRGDSRPGPGFEPHTTRWPLS